MARIVDSGEFERLVRVHAEALFRYGLRLCSGRAADAEDLLQDAALRAWRAASQLRDVDHGKAWLFRIVTTTHLNRVRAEQRRAETVVTDLGDRAFEEALASWTPIAGPEEELLRRMDAQTLSNALDQLPEAWRAAVWLSDVEGFGQREIAGMLGIPEGTVASRLFRGRRALRGLLTVGASDLATPIGRCG
jgi:RNA polymerase sigma-70 factor (ECF subfamily)